MYFISYLCHYRIKIYIYISRCWYLPVYGLKYAPRHMLWTWTVRASSEQRPGAETKNWNPMFQQTSPFCIHLLCSVGTAWLWPALQSVRASKLVDTKHTLRASNIFKPCELSAFSTTTSVEVLLLSLFQGIRTIKSFAVLSKLQELSFFCLPKAIFFVPCFGFPLEPGTGLHDCTTLGNSHDFAPTVKH